MYLKKTTNKKNSRIYLSLAKSYRDKETGISKTKTVESIGYVDELEKKYDDPIAHYTKVAKAKTIKESKDNQDYTIRFRKDDTLAKNTVKRMNYGYIVLMKMYHRLGLDRFLINRQRGKKFEYNTSSIMQLLVMDRILDPGSKKKVYDSKGKYFERFDFELENVYRSLSHFAKIDAAIQKQIYKSIGSMYERNIDCVYYDVTNYYFEIDEEDDFRKKGVSKENRTDPIVQMGLAMDTCGIPISYDLFEGNHSEKYMLRPMVGKIVRQYDCKKVIAVADKAQNTGNNIYYLGSGKCGYVFSQSILGGSEEFQNYVLDSEDYRLHKEDETDPGIIIKSRRIAREINVEFMKDGKTKTVKKTVPQKQVIYFSKKYAKRQKKKREKAIEKALKLINNPDAFNNASAKGCRKYIDNLKFDKKTKEVVTPKEQLFLNVDKIREEEKFDGYYALVTSELEKEDFEIVDIYHGLWRIEESFKITKSYLDARPAYVSREDHIRAHFLTCYIALVMVRLIQKELNYQYPVESIIDTLRDINCSHESENLYLFDHRTDLSDALGNAFGIDFTKKRLSLSDIKKNIGEVKIT